ncbi:MAG: AAA family ATPase, partial [Vigna little leaf phytoplasma]|nr:AAA family ATPase [Vigna little leaf phytoplasma]
QITADQKLAVEEKQRYIDNLQELEGHINVLNQKISDLNNENKTLLETTVTQYTSLAENLLKTSENLSKLTEVILKNQEKNVQSILKTENSAIAQQFLKNMKDHPGFDEVIGMKNIVEQLKESLNYLLYPDLYKHMGVKKTQKGILLYGPPGTGKSFLANVFAKEAGLPFFALSSDDFAKKYVGEGPKLINAIFEEARKIAPSIILIDDCDAVFESRVSDKVSSDHGNIITAFLSQIEGVRFDKNKHILIMGTTNYKDNIDPAILSRFNRLIFVDTWSETEINGFLKKKSQSYALDIRAEQYLEQIMAQITNSERDDIKTPRKIIELLEHAGIIAVKHKHLNILPEDLQLAFEQITETVEPNKWELHFHKKHDLQQLFSIKEYKQSPLKHLFLDSNLLDEEKKYFNLIKERYLFFNKPVYNSDKQNNNNIKIIDFNENKEAIKYNYNSENPLPDDLLGFYFDYKTNKENQNTVYLPQLSNINSLEDILNAAIKAKIEKIYFIWNLNKKGENDKIVSSLLEEFKSIYPFLKFDNNLDLQAKICALNIDNNYKEIRQFILNYLINIKNQLIKNILNKLNLGNTSKWEQIVLQQVNTIWRKKLNFYNLDDLQTQIINKILADFKNSQRAEKRSYNKLI